MRQSRGTLHLADDRIERAVGVLRRAEIAQARVRLAGEAFQNRGGESRFADPCLAGKQHHLAFTALCLRPAPQQQFGFFFPPDEGDQAGRVQRLEAAFHRTCPQRGPRLLEVFCPEVLELEEVAEKFARALGDDHHVRFGDALQARRKIRRLTDDAAFLRLSRSDNIADHDQPGRDADAALQRSVRLEPGHRRDQLQARPHRPFRVVLMRLRVAEIHQHSVAQIFRHEPAEAAHRFGDALLIGRNDLAQILRVHASGERRRSDQVREHHRDLPALGSILGLWLRQCGLRRCGCGGAKLRNRCQ